MRVELLEYPGERDWIEVYRRALVTVGKDTVKIPSKDYLVPMCEYAGCHEMKPCGRKSNVGE